MNFVDLKIDFIDRLRAKFPGHTLERSGWVDTNFDPLAYALYVDEPPRKNPNDRPPPILIAWSDTQVILNPGPNLEVKTPSLNSIGYGDIEEIFNGVVAAVQNLINTRG
jgi:hypothetical protein